VTNLTPVYINKSSNVKFRNQESVRTLRDIQPGRLTRMAMGSVGDLEVGSGSKTRHGPKSHSVHHAETLPIQPGIR
jgi:hypothetical protein